MKDRQVQLFTATMAATGMHPPANFIADGRLHLFSPDGEGTQADGWYVLRHEVRLMGAFGCHRRGIALAWADTGATLWHDELAREQRSLRARLEAFSSGISAASERHDSELVQHLAAAMIFVAERLGELGAAP